MNRNYRSDRRTQRTRRKLNTAMVGLIEEKRFDEITVQNVIDRAEVARGTFYSHCTGTEDLFDQPEAMDGIFHRLVNPTLRSALPTGHKSPVGAERKAHWAAILRNEFC